MQYSVILPITSCLLGSDINSCKSPWEPEFTEEITKMIQWDKINLKSVFESMVNVHWWKSSAFNKLLACDYQVAHCPDPRSVLLRHILGHMWWYNMEVA